MISLFLCGLKDSSESKTSLTSFYESSASSGEPSRYQEPEKVGNESEYCTAHAEQEITVDVGSPIGLVISFRDEAEFIANGTKLRSKCSSSESIRARNDLRTKKSKHLYNFDESDTDSPIGLLISFQSESQSEPSEGSKNLWSSARRSPEYMESVKISRLRKSKPKKYYNHYNVAASPLGLVISFRDRTKSHKSSGTDHYSPAASDSLECSWSSTSTIVSTLSHDEIL